MTTITHEQFEAIANASDYDETGRALAAAGIAIAPPQPSPEMVTLAEAICYEVETTATGPRDYALAALQHVKRVVKDAGQAGYDKDCGGDLISRTAILTAIGGNGRGV